MAALEELRKKLKPLLNVEAGQSEESAAEPSSSCIVSDEGVVNLLSKSYGLYNINELGLQKRSTGLRDDEVEINEKSIRCASHEMHVFGPIGSGASSVVYGAIHIPTHRILALKRISIFEKEKRQQFLNEIRTLCDASCYPGLVEFHGAYYSPDSGQINIALEYMDGGSLADVLRAQKFTPEPILAAMVHRLLHGLNYLHKEKHLVHRDIKPANLLVNLEGDTKISDFGISSDLDNTIAMCASFVGTVTYMSPERIRSEKYSYPADIWSLGLTILECGTGKFPYNAEEGLANLMIQILHDPSPSPARDMFSPEFCSFVDDCLQKDANARPSAEQLLSHPFIKKYENSGGSLLDYVRKVFDPAQKLKKFADMLAVHYYLLFDGSDDLWNHTKTFYTEGSSFSFSGKEYVGGVDIFNALSDIRRKLMGARAREKLVHVVEKLHCRSHAKNGIMIRASGSFILGSHFLICGEGIQAEGMPNMKDQAIDLSARRVGTFHEQFVLETGYFIGSFLISKQELYIMKN